MNEKTKWNIVIRALAGSSYTVKEGSIGDRMHEAGNRRGVGDNANERRGSLNRRSNAVVQKKSEHEDEDR